MTYYSGNWFDRNIDRWPDFLGALLLGFGLIVFISEYFGWSVLYIPILSDLLLRIWPELIGIGLAVIIIDNANELLRTREEKKRLILQMGSPDNAFAREAVRQLRARGWLKDGSLRRAFLLRANLRGAILRYANLMNARLAVANLERADLEGAYMEGADLGKANLKGAKVKPEQLAKAESLEGAIMPDGTVYNPETFKDSLEEHK